MKSLVGMSARIRSAFERLFWGGRDLVRQLSAAGWWPGFAAIGISDDNSSWLLRGSHLTPLPSSTDRPTCLVVLERQCLWGQTTLPDMPVQSLPGAVQEVFWRSSPLPLEQIYSAWTSEPEPSGGWLIHWGLCKRTSVDSASSTSKFTRVFLQRGDSALPVTELLTSKDKRQDGFLSASAWALFTMLIFGVFAMAAMPLVLKRDSAVAATEAISVLEPKARPLRTQLDALRLTSELTDAVNKGFGSSAPLADVLELLSIHMPDDTWLDRLEVSGTEIRISGATADTTSLVSKLSAQVAFAGVRPTSPSVRDAAVNKERFSLEMHWNPQGARQ